MVVADVVAAAAAAVAGVVVERWVRMMLIVVTAAAAVGAGTVDMVAIAEFVVAAHYMEVVEFDSGHIAAVGCSDQVTKGISTLPVGFDRSCSNSDSCLSSKGRTNFEREKSPPTWRLTRSSHYFVDTSDGEVDALL